MVKFLCWIVGIEVTVSLLFYSSVSAYYGCIKSSELSNFSDGFINIVPETTVFFMLVTLVCGQYP